MQLRLLRDPDATRYRFRAFAASALAHALLVVVLFALRTEAPDKPWFLMLVGSGDSLVSIDMVYLPPGRPAPELGATEAEEGGGLPENARGGAAPPLPAREIMTLPVAPREAPRGLPRVARAPDSVAAGGEGEGEGEAEPFVMPSSPGVRFGDGSLWQEPLFIGGMRELLEEIEADVDLAGRMQAIFDSVQAEPGAIQRLPDWAFALPGLGSVGLNQKWIQVGPIKIPAAVLALLPFPQGNFDEAIRRQELADQRRDLLAAAQRAYNVKVFKEEVRKIRERMQRERDLRYGGRRDTTATINP